MILADTSAWIEYDRGTGSAVHRRVRHLIETAGELAVTDPVVMELLVGARHDAHSRALREFLLRFEFLPFDPATDFDGAVRIYRRCRSVGFTPRGTVDCMIASVASRYGAALLCHDADLARIADVMDLRLDEASLA